MAAATSTALSVPLKLAGAQMTRAEASVIH
jgi:hypothetical protein